MNKHLRIFLAGVVVTTPFVVTAYVIWWIVTKLDSLARIGLESIVGTKLFLGAGVIVVLAAIYLIGLLTHFWVFRWALGLLERLFARLPLVKTIYESARDVIGLFSGDANKMGQVVRYRIPGTEIELLGIQTSTSPRAAGESGKVSVYLPMSYMFGGLTVYVRPEAVEPVDMSVEEALKIAATAEAGGAAAQQAERSRSNQQK